MSTEGMHKGKCIRCCGAKHHTYINNKSKLCPACERIERAVEDKGYANAFKTRRATRDVRSDKRGDATPLIRSINQAASILRRRGYVVDTYDEMPRSSAPDYFIVLRHLNKTLWAKVRSTTPAKKGTKKK